MHLWTLGNNFKKHHKATLVRTTDLAALVVLGAGMVTAISPSGIPGCMAVWQSGRNPPPVVRQTSPSPLLTSLGGNLLDHSGLQLLRHAIEHTVNNQ